ncbi:type II toxin-antitoxin system VapC family toxin [soil metagenome]
MDQPFILFDSDILIDTSRGISQAVQTLEEFEQTHTLSVSVVTKLELMVGCKNKKEFKELNKFLDRFKVFHLSETISRKTVELFQQYRLSHDVLIADMLIASTALTYELELISKNQKDFKFIDDLKLIKYTVQ